MRAFCYGRIFGSICESCMVGKVLVAETAPIEHRRNDRRTQGRRRMPSDSDFHSLPVVLARVGVRSSYEFFCLRKHARSHPRCIYRFRYWWRQQRRRTSVDDGGTDR